MVELWFNFMQMAKSCVPPVWPVDWTFWEQWQKKISVFTHFHLQRCKLPPAPERERWRGKGIK